MKIGCRAAAGVAVTVSLVAGQALASAGLAARADAIAAASGVSWGKATQVPGLRVLNTGNFAQVTSMSCTASGNCAAGGFYRDRSRHNQAFVVSRKNGSWGQASRVSGPVLSGSRYSALTTVSCARRGYCAVGGIYQDPSRNSQAFVVSEKAGIWGRAMEVPGTAALNTFGIAEVSSVSCASPGNCTAGGHYSIGLDPLGNPISQGFVVTEKNGSWGKAAAVHDASADSSVTSVSCASPGNCSAGTADGFLLNEKGGAWGKAVKVGWAVASVSCASAGSCTAAGGMVISEVNGTWGTATVIPGLAALGSGEILSLSCASPDNCSAGGVYQFTANSRSYDEAFVVSEVSGAWGTARKVPGTASLNTGGEASVNSVSCASPGNCAAGGFYTDRRNNQQAFVVRQAGGSWRNALEVPVTAVLNTGGDAQVFSVSCAKAGLCSGGGWYKHGGASWQAFVVSET